MVGEGRAVGSVEGGTAGADGSAGAAPDMVDTEAVSACASTVPAVDLAADGLGTVSVLCQGKGILKARTEDAVIALSPHFGGVIHVAHQPTVGGIGNSLAQPLPLG